MTHPASLGDIQLKLHECMDGRRKERTLLNGRIAVSAGTYAQTATGIFQSPARQARRAASESPCR